MPWCDECAKFWNPNSMPASGHCPRCGAKLAEPRQVLEHSAVDEAADDDADDAASEGEEYRAPWHFKLLVVMAAVYLLWRFVQLVALLV